MFVPVSKRPLPIQWLAVACTVFAVVIIQPSDAQRPDSVSLPTNTAATQTNSLITNAANYGLFYIAGNGTNTRFYIHKLDGTTNSSPAFYAPFFDRNGPFGDFVWATQTDTLAMNDVHGNVYTLGPQDTNPQLILQTPPGEDGGDNLAWSSDGKYLAFETDPDLQNASASLDVYTPDGRIVTLVSPAEGRLIGQIIWSPDNSNIAFLTRDEEGTANGGEPDIYIVSTSCLTNAATQCQENTLASILAHQYVVSPPHNWDTPFWSPDGKQLAFRCSDETTNTSPLCIANINSSSLQSSAVSDIWRGYPVWLPGNQIVSAADYLYSYDLSSQLENKQALDLNIGPKDAVMVIAWLPVNTGAITMASAVQNIQTLPSTLLWAHSYTAPTLTPKPAVTSTPTIPSASG